MKKKDISSAGSFEHLPPIEHDLSEPSHQKQALFTHKGSSSSVAQQERLSPPHQHSSDNSCSSFTHHSSSSESMRSFSGSVNTTTDSLPVSSARRRIMTAQEFEKMGMRKVDSDESLSSKEELENSRSGKTTLPSLSSSNRGSDSDLEPSLSSEFATSLSSFSTGGFAITQEDIKAVGKVLETSYVHGHTSRSRVKRLRETFLQCVEVDPSISKTSNFGKKKEKIEKALEKILLKKIEEQKQKEKNASSLFPLIKR